MFLSKSSNLNHLNTKSSTNKQYSGNDIENHNFIELQNNIKTLDNYQPSISDQIKVGFYSSDRTTQTNETEILDLKNATENLDYLCKEIDVVKNDLKYAKNSFQNQFEQDLFNKSIEIYGLINNKITELKSEQEESLERIRRAYKSKLSNSISYFKKLAEDQKNDFILYKQMNSKKPKQGTSENVIQKMKELQRVIAEQEIIIKDMKQKELETTDANNAENERILDELKETKERAAESATKFNNKLKRFEETLMIKEEESEKIMAEVTNLQMQLEKEKIHYEQLSKDFNEYKAKSEQEKSKMKKDFEKQKIAIETKLNEKFKESRDQLMNAAKQELKQQQLLQKQQEQQLLEQKKYQEQQYQRMLKEQQEALEKEKIEKEKEIESIKNDKKYEEEQYLKEQLSLAEALQREKERELNSKSNSKDTELILKLKSNEFFLKTEINRLKREIHRNNETWEKKFDILKQSLHAIKDEMYLRQNLQKQSAQLAYASVGYAMNQPPILQQQFPQSVDSKNHIENYNKTSSNSSYKPVLPHIGGINKLNDRPLSVTISIPSRLSGHMENEESQIVDDEEMNRLKEEFFNDIDFIPAKQA